YARLETAPTLVSFAESASLVSRAPPSSSGIRSLAPWRAGRRARGRTALRACGPLVRGLRPRAPGSVCQRLGARRGAPAAHRRTRVPAFFRGLRPRAPTRLSSLAEQAPDRAAAVARGAGGEWHARFRVLFPRRAARRAAGPAAELSW